MTIEPSEERLCPVCGKQIQARKAGRATGRPRRTCGPECAKAYRRVGEPLWGKPRPRHHETTRKLALHFLRQGWSCRRIGAELKVHFTSVARWGREDFHRRQAEAQARLVG